MTSDDFTEALSCLIVEAEDSGVVRVQILAEIEAVTEAMWNAEECALRGTSGRNLS